jgi:hypothetical protein
MMAEGNSILSQLIAAQPGKGIWGGCAPGRYTDPDLAYMLRHHLIDWDRKLEGYVLTDKGERAVRLYSLAP